LTGKNKATISELPIKKWTQDYREFLETSMSTGTKKGDKDKLLEDYTEHHTEKVVHFDLVLNNEYEGDKGLDRLEKALKLRTTVSLNNMMLFDADGKITKYDSPLEILKDFCRVRLVMYERRKAHMLARLQRQSEILSEKARFIKLVLTHDIKVKKRKILDLVNDLKKHSFKALREIKGPDLDDEAAPDEDDKDSDEDESGDEELSEEQKKKKATRQGVKDFEYLVGMAIVTLTYEKIQELNAQKDLKLQERDALKKRSPKQIWGDDLDVLEEALNERMKLRAKEDREERSKIEKARSKAGSKDKKRAAAEEAADAKEKQREAKRVATTSASSSGLGRLKKVKTV